MTIVGLLPRRTVIQLEPEEHAFLLYGLYKVSTISKAVIGYPSRTLMKWTRPQVSRRVTAMCRILRDEVMAISLTSPLDEAIIAEAIGGNLYFVEMEAGDSRLNAEAVYQIQALRKRVQFQSRYAIQPV